MTVEEPVPNGDLVRIYIWEYQMWSIFIPVAFKVIWSTTWTFFLCFFVNGKKKGEYRTQFSPYFIFLLIIMDFSPPDLLLSPTAPSWFDWWPDLLLTCNQQGTRTCERPKLYSMALLAMNCDFVAIDRKSNEAVWCFFFLAFAFLSSMGFSLLCIPLTRLCPVLCLFLLSKKKIRRNNQLHV